MQRLLKRPCAIKKLMVDVSELIFQSPKDPILPPLVYTWEDLLTGEVVVVTAEAAVVTAAAVTETMTTAATAGVAAEVAAEAAEGMAAAAVEAVAPLLLITEADHEGTTVHGPDLTHHVSNPVDPVDIVVNVNNTTSKEQDRDVSRSIPSNKTE